MISFRCTIMKARISAEAKKIYSGVGLSRIGLWVRFRVDLQRLDQLLPFSHIMCNGSIRSFVSEVSDRNSEVEEEGAGFG